MNKSRYPCYRLSNAVRQVHLGIYRQARLRSNTNIQHGQKPPIQSIDCLLEETNPGIVRDEFPADAKVLARKHHPSVTISKPEESSSSLRRPTEPSLGRKQRRSSFYHTLWARSAIEPEHDAQAAGCHQALTVGHLAHRTRRGMQMVQRFDYREVKARIGIAGLDD
jgi:hypothetical protein